MLEKEDPPIIDTIKGRQGHMDTFIPVNSKGEPLIPEEVEIEAYDKRGKKKKPRPVKGKIVNTKV